MKKNYIYIIGIAFALLSAGCGRIDTPPVDVQTGENIVFAPDVNTATATKGLLESGSLNRTNTKIKVYDFISGFDGKIGDQTITPSQTVKYFDDMISYYDGNTGYWPYWNPDLSTGLGTTGAPDPDKVYPWTKSGQHSFFGWLVEDGTEMGLSANTLFGAGQPSFNESTRVLTVPATALTTSSTQFDFSYSDVKNVDAATRTVGSTVPMQLKHLFGAIGITIKNNSKTDRKVYSVKLKNFPNMSSAVLTYDLTTGVNVSYATPTVSGEFWPNKIATPITLYNLNDAVNGGKVYDVFTGTELVDDADPAFLLAWPMTYESLEPTVQSTDPEDGHVTYTSDSPVIEVVYGDAASSEYGTFQYRFPKVLPIETEAIAAGKKYRLDLSFSDKQIEISFKQLPWDYEEYPMAYEEDAISATQLKFVTDTFVPDGKLYDINGKHDVIKLSASSSAGAYIAKGEFKAYTPVNGVLTVGLSGNTEDFYVSLDSGTSASGAGSGNESITINPNRDGGLITFTIRPKGTPTSGSRVFLHFSVRNNGRESDADSEINRDNYVVIIP